MTKNVQEHLAAGAATGTSLALPFDLNNWLIHVGTSVLVGLITWGITHALKALWRKIR